MNETEQLLEQVTDRVGNSARRYERCGRTMPEPLDAGEIARAEAILGFALPRPPPLPASLYTRVGDGGFGPGQGLLPLRQAVLAHEERRSSEWCWPEGVLPVADFGCAMDACVDYRSDTAQVLLFDPNPGEPEPAWPGGGMRTRAGALGRVQIPDLSRHRTP
ncbi:SMI1/KNR4 family protein [Streptomyces sp. NPDC091682]|uniref:SMI1/KNR4 family protein n=1 Tax=Streptomyces sp. NPDC091682 TaxID=3366005 RepID=UPI0037FCDFD9